MTLQSPLGNPDAALTDPASRTKYLIQRNQYHLSYNDDTHQANWVSWSYSSADTGSQGRTDAWAEEELLPSGYLRIGTATFGTSYGISWDRGHMTPSADRTKNYDDNAATFRMSNIIPQASANNQGLWATFENYCRSLAAGDNEVLVISGPSEFTGNRIGNSMSVPGSVWKIVVVVPNASSGTPANQRITTASRVIAILTPNVSTGLGTWDSYITSVEEIEEVTGLNFFTSIDPNVAIYLKNIVDTGTGPNAPTVVTTFSPTLGAPGTSVRIFGYNFNGSSTVKFNGVDAATRTVVSANEIVATVPAGATTGLITVTGPGGTDTSYENFTVTSGPVTPTVSVSPASLTGLTALQGTAGNSLVYAVNGSNLTSPVTVTAPAHFEISVDGTNFTPTLNLVPSIDGSLGTQVSVRITSNAPIGAVSGNISHTSAGATTKEVGLSGSVASNLPQITLSPAALTNFTSLQGTAGPAKTYSVSGANLSGNITVTAPAGYEVGLDNSTFASSLALAPSNGSIPITTIYVRLSSAAALGSRTGSITHTGGGATPQSLSVSGTVSPPGSAETWTATSGTNTKGQTNTGQSFAGKSGVWINEFHYDTVNTDVGEFVEIVVGPDVTSPLANIVLVLYNGADGSAYGTHALSTFTLGSTVDGYRIFHKDIPGLQNGAPDGFAVSVDGAAVQFLSYEGTFTATAGAANGMTSTDVGVFEGGAVVGSSLQLTGSSGSGPTAPAITVSGPANATALDPFTYQIAASNNPESYAVTGQPAWLSLNAQTGVLSGTPPAGAASYTIVLTATNAGGTGTASLTLNVSPNPNAPSITSNLIVYGQINSAFGPYQITASNNPASYTAANLPAGLTINTLTGVISGTPTIGGTFNATISAINEFGNDSETLQIIVREPLLVVTPETLRPFTANAGFNSATQSYTLTGSQLTGTITVRAPQYFEISAAGGAYADELTFTPLAGETISQSILIRLSNSAPPGSHTGSISHTGSGATPKYLQLNGTVSTSEPTLTVSATELAPFAAVSGSASNIQTYELAGASLNGVVTVTAPEGFEVGTDDESFGVAVELTPVNGALAATAIYVRLHAEAAVGTYSGLITHSGGGAAVKTIALSGSISAPVGPNIIATSGGSAYVNASYTYRIQTDGAQTVTSYGAIGLPPGLTVNTATGVISGAATAAGTYEITLQAASSQGTSQKPYTLRVLTSAQQLSTPTVVVNKYQNATVDRVELLVTGDNINGPPVDVRGMIVKDFNGNMATDAGGKYIFTDHPLWSNVKAGTLIILTAGNNFEEDLDPSDFVLAVNLANATYFSEASGGFDIGNTDMIMIKSAGMQPDGVAGGIHALAMGTSGAQYTSYSGRKTQKGDPLSSSRTFSYVVNGTTSLADYYATEGADRANNLIFGSGHNNRNRGFIANLRALDQDGPVITLQGSNPVAIQRGATYSDAGATAFDQRDNQSKTVTSSGTVNTSKAGTYTITYSATDSKGNIGTATRTVNVLAPAAVPATVATSSASDVSVATVTFNGNVSDSGSSAVTARGFVYSTVNATLNVNAEGATTLNVDSGAGAFSTAVTGLAPGTSYYFRAFATNEAGTSYGETLSFITLKAEPLLHPADFAAGTVTTSRIPVAWSVTEADGYLLVVSAGAGLPPNDGVAVTDDTDVSDGSGAINLAAGTTSYNGFTGFAPGQSYTFRIYAFNNGGGSIDYKTGSAPTFTASILTTPELSVSGTPAPLATTYGTASDATTFAVSGIYLTSTVSVTAPSGFEVSPDNTTYATEITLTPDAGSLPPTTIYLRLTATANVGGTYDAQAINISSGGANSITLNTAASGHSVEPRALHVSGLGAVEKMYDGTTAVTVVGSPSYEGLVNSESFPVIGNVAWAFNDRNVGPNKVLVRMGDFEAPSANYRIAAQPSLAASITAKPLTVAGATVTTKSYDTTTSATIAGATLVGVVDGDTVTVSGGGHFDDANAGENKTVTANLTLGGADAANYTLTQPSLAGTITKADQTINFEPLPARSVHEPPFPLAANASSGLTVDYASSNEAVATVSGNTVILRGAGTAIITATQGGDSNYNAAAPMAQTLEVKNTSSFTMTLGALSNGTSVATKTYSAAFDPAAVVFASSPGAFVQSGGLTHALTDGAFGYANWAGWEDQSRYFYYSVTAEAGHRLSINAINSNLRSSSTGPRSIAVETAKSLDGPWIKVAESNLTETTNTSVNAAGLGIDLEEGETLYIRYRTASATSVNGGTVSSAGTMRINSGSIEGTFSPVVAPDTTAPIITLLGDNPLIVPAGTAFIDPGATALDETDDSVQVSAYGEVNADVPGSYIVTYTATDTAGNTGTATRTVNVVDITPPVITVAGSNPLYLPVGATFIEPGVSAFDTIDGNVEVQAGGAMDTSARGTFILTYKATDAAGNVATATREVIVRSAATHLLETKYGLLQEAAFLTNDADNDGVANLMEYAFGTDPASSADAPRATELHFTDEGARFSAVVRDGDTALSVTPMASTDLSSGWSSASLIEVTSDQTGVPGGFRRRTWEVPGTNTTLFIRFEIRYD